MEMTAENQAKETPLTELLRDVPEGHRTEWEVMWAEDGRAIGHSLCPIGLIAHKAADKIDELESKVRALQCELHEWIP